MAQRTTNGAQRLESWERGTLPGERKAPQYVVNGIPPGSGHYAEWGRWSAADETAGLAVLASQSELCRKAGWSYVASYIAVDVPGA